VRAARELHGSRMHIPGFVAQPVEKQQDADPVVRQQ
jgi:hypothetical protein